jgi:hypothetical protein
LKDEARDVWPRSERSQRLLDQLELQLEDTATAAGEDEVKARRADLQPGPARELNLNHARRRRQNPLIGR